MGVRREGTPRLEKTPDSIGAESVPAVRVNAVAPGPILGGMNTPERLAENPENTQRKINVTAMKRFARPEEVADSVLYLLGPGAAYITGAILDVDGGTTPVNFERLP